MFSSDSKSYNTKRANTNRIACNTRTVNKAIFYVLVKAVVEFYIFSFLKKFLNSTDILVLKYHKLILPLAYLYFLIFSKRRSLYRILNIRFFIILNS